MTPPQPAEAALLAEFESAEVLWTEGDTNTHTEGEGVCSAWERIFREDMPSLVIDSMHSTCGAIQKLGAGRYVMFGYGAKNPDQIRRDLFRLIDNTPNLIWALVTRFPGNVMGTWPHRLIAAGNQTSRNGVPRYLSNVHIYATITDQASADAAIPDLLKLRDLTPVLGVDGVLAGPVDFERHFGSRWERKIPCQNIFMPPSIRHVRIRGETGPNARPLHPQWVRSARDQCVAANVPFEFNGWGEFIPHSQAMQVEDFPVATTDWLYNLGDDDDAARVGSAQSGRLLDGREWRETPE